MTRLILLIILGLVTALYFPDSRAMVMEKAAPLIDPALGMATELEMEKIVRELESQDRNLRGRLPDRRQWRGWLDEHYAATAGEDSWGRPYGYDLWADSFAVISYGPDRVLNTDDDIRVLRMRSGSRRR